MTDRELLEFAAKAAGLAVRWEEHPGRLLLVEGFDDVGWWNPLTDDGDALRLAVRLNMHLTLDAYGAAARIGEVGNVWHGCESHLHGGLEAATRRAIVRAAAEIGKQTA